MAQKTLQYQQVKKDAEINSSPPTRNKMNGVKPFLLLSILDLTAQGSISKNFIEPSFELVETFNTGNRGRTGLYAEEDI